MTSRTKFGNKWNSKNGLEESQEFPEIEINEEEQIALELQKQEEFERWLENLRERRAADPTTSEHQESDVNLFWLSGEEN